MTHLLTLVLLAAQPGGDGQETLNTIDRTRGGRHWVDEKTEPPKSPAESLKCFQIEPGARIELVAAEPLVMDPVAIAFDRRGRMFVAEYGDYPIGPPEGEPPLSRVVLLEDRDGDGRLDHRQVFADRLNFVHNVMAYRDGILVGAQTEIIHLRDTDGDDVADERDVLYRGFVPAHPQMQIGCGRWGLDNQVYLNYGPGKIVSSKSPEEPVEFPRLDFRFDPRTLEFGPDSGLGQYGNTIDNWGHRFFATNRNPIMVSMLPREAVARNPYVVIPKAYTDVGPSGGDTRVYPLVAMKSNWLAHAGTHTSACGVTAYRGDLFGEEFTHSVFACEPVGHLVTRSIVKPDGVSLTAERAREKADFLASSDTWFRPASLATGPGGALYVADMYRLWVEHPKFLPDEIAEKLDWRAGEDRGRIWRVLPEGVSPRPYDPPETTAEFVALLKDTNGWRRYLGQQLLVERQSKDAIAELKSLLTNNKSAFTRLHALWTLDGLDALTTDLITTAMKDTDPFIRRDAVKLAARFLKDDAILDEISKRADDSDVRVRYQVALALGEVGGQRAAELLTQLALRDGADEWFALAILTSARESSGVILTGLMNDGDFRQRGSAADRNLVRQLAGVVGARGDLTELAALFETIASTQQTGQWWQTAALGGLAEGLTRHRGGLGRTSLPNLLASPPPPLSRSAEPVKQLLQRTQEIAVDSNRRRSDRIAAVELLAYQPVEQALPAFEELLAAHQPVELQQACLDAMSRSTDARCAEIALERWPTLGPMVQGPALDLLLRRTPSTRAALEAMSVGKIAASAVGLDDRVRLLKHGDEAIRKLAEKLFGGAVSENRREVAEQYMAALDRKASAAEGFKVFQRLCAKCHRVDGQGFEVGPDISDVRNRSRDALLYDILDPNRKVEPRFAGYTAVTADGRIFTGLMISESAEAIVLRQPEGKQQVIARAEIEALKTDGKSLMPEGVEKDVTVDQMADLLEYLKSPRQKQAARADE